MWSVHKDGHRFISRIGVVPTPTEWKFQETAGTWRLVKYQTQRYCSRSLIGRNGYCWNDACFSFFSKHDDP